jgi:acyl-CoA oxidase
MADCPAENAYFAEKALMIAVRYAVVRRQFSLKGDNAGEMPLMDYQTHKYRLLIPLATAYAMHFTFRETYGLYQRLMQALEGAKADPAKLPQTVEDLKEAHGTCAGLKAHTGWLTMKIIEGCRQACGGHGYSAYSGLPSLYQDFVVQTTWEVLLSSHLSHNSPPFSQIRGFRATTRC